MNKINFIKIFFTLISLITLIIGFAFPDNNKIFILLVILVISAITNIYYFCTKNSKAFIR
jgi:uncharacterized membrane protein YqjE